MQLLFIIHHARAIVKFYSRRKTRPGAPFRKLFREFCVNKMKSAFTPALPDSRLFRTAAKTFRSALSSLIPCTADHAPPCFFRTHPKAPRLSTSESLPRIGFRCGFRRELDFAADFAAQIPCAAECRFFSRGAACGHIPRYGWPRYPDSPCSSRTNSAHENAPRRRTRRPAPPPPFPRAKDRWQTLRP